MIKVNTVLLLIKFKFEHALYDEVYVIKIDTVDVKSILESQPSVAEQ